MTKKMILKLLPNGEIMMETKGVKGKKCLNYIDLLKKLVDVNVTDTKVTDEYFETEAQLETFEDDNININYSE
jgi:hypothetical protein